MTLMTLMETTIVLFATAYLAGGAVLVLDAIRRLLNDSRSMG